MVEILYKEFSYKINGILFDIHNKLGRFCNHKQYCDAFEVILKKEKINYKREIEIPIEFEGIKLTGNILDFLIDDKIVLDIKCKKEITTKDYVQMKRYLKASNRELGIIVNFSETTLKPKRILNKK
ncbi:MAG: GxxExxY protein [Candidatus Moranbacteria bacterium]|nr:GxxExxY protein [Candidatus Moranbacteria bacterium]